MKARDICRVCNHFACLIAPDSICGEFQDLEDAVTVDIDRLLSLNRRFSPSNFYARYIKN